LKLSVNFQVTFFQDFRHEAWPVATIHASAKAFQLPNRNDPKTYGTALLG
jgi:hypothetical protein